MRTLLLGLALILTACAPKLQTQFDATKLPAATEYGPHAVPMEWWYLSSSLPEQQLAFHWAQFKFWPGKSPLPVMLTHIAVTDLKTGKVQFIEQSPGLGKGNITYPPLHIESEDWRFDQLEHKPLSPFTLKAGPLDLKLTPLKNPVLHPPGYSGTAETGQLYYQGITRLALSGEIAGKPVQGTAWFDHQWGNQRPYSTALWDWISVQLPNNEELMVYRVMDVQHNLKQLMGSIVDAQGVARAATDLQMEPGRRWKSATGTEYVLSWKLRAAEFNLSVEAINDAQELVSKDGTAYWEGPIKVSGLWRGQPQTGNGMMELVAKGR